MPISAETMAGRLSHASMAGRLSSASMLGRLSIVAGAPPYTGETSFTPSAEAQTVPTAGRTMNADITIEPIPSNYGLITWDGSTITVS